MTWMQHWFKTKMKLKQSCLKCMKEKGLVIQCPKCYHIEEEEELRTRSSEWGLGFHQFPLWLRISSLSLSFTYNFFLLAVNQSRERASNRGKISAIRDHKWPQRTTEDTTSLHCPAMRSWSWRGTKSVSTICTESVSTAFQPSQNRIPLFWSFVCYGNGGDPKAVGRTEIQPLLRCLFLFYFSLIFRLLGLTGEAEKSPDNKKLLLLFCLCLFFFFFAVSKAEL